MSDVDSPRDLRRIFIFYENILSMREVTVCAKELGTMSKYNLRGITLGERLTLSPVAMYNYEWTYLQIQHLT